MLNALQQIGIMSPVKDVWVDAPRKRKTQQPTDQIVNEYTADIGKTSCVQL
jgi:hypothetical protein